MCITRAFIYVLYITSRAHFNPTSEWRHPKQKLWQISSKHLSSPPSVSDPRNDLQPCPNMDGLSDNEKDNPKQTNSIAIGAYKSLSIYIVSGLFACRVYAWLHDFWGRPRMTLVTMHSMSVRGVRFVFFFLGAIFYSTNVHPISSVGYELRLVWRKVWGFRFMILFSTWQFFHWITLPGRSGGIQGVSNVTLRLQYDGKKSPTTIRFNIGFMFDPCATVCS